MEHSPDSIPADGNIAAMSAQTRQQFGALLERHRKIVFKVANTYARNPDDRADLAQEIAAQLWRAYPGYDPQRVFSTWMYRIALNAAISHVRSAQHQRLVVSLDEALHELTDDGVDQEADAQLRALHRCIAQFEPLNRALLLLYLEDRSYREIAEILGISETNVATKIGRLKQRIREQLTTES
jgi:RNA polymerase sigma factor (sigma-70 family)